MLTPSSGVCDVQLGFYARAFDVVRNSKPLYNLSQSNPPSLRLGRCRKLSAVPKNSVKPAAIEPDVHFAYCELLHRVAIHIRAYNDIDRKQVWALMEATENIPLYLRSGDPHSLSAVQHGMDWYDREFSERKFGLRLNEIYTDAVARFHKA